MTENLNLSFGMIKDIRFTKVVQMNAADSMSHRENFRTAKTDNVYQFKQSQWAQAFGKRPRVKPQK